MENTNTRKMKCMRIFYCDKKSQKIEETFATNDEFSLKQT